MFLSTFSLIDPNVILLCHLSIMRVSTLQFSDLFLIPKFLHETEKSVFKFLVLSRYRSNCDRSAFLRVLRTTCVFLLSRFIHNVRSTSHCWDVLLIPKFLHETEKRVCKFGDGVCYFSKV